VIFALLLSLLMTAMLRGLRQQRALTNPWNAGDSTVTAALPGIDTDPGYSGGSQQSITALLISVNDFNRVMASVTPRQTVDLLNRFYAQVAALVAEHHGYIDHCDGATVRATWAATAELSNHQVAAVDCAAAICNQVTPVAGPVNNDGNPPMQLTLALHTGPAVLGQLGLPGRARVHALGETVDQLARINEAGKKFGCPVVLSAASVEGAGIAELCFPLDRVALDGDTQSATLYALSEPFRERNRLSISAAELQRKLSSGFEYYCNRDWHSAAKIYGHVGKCVLSNLFVERCLRYQTDERGLKLETAGGHPPE
jgi:class 3 adenylate cyclase